MRKWILAAGLLIVVVGLLVLGRAIRKEPPLQQRILGYGEYGKEEKLVALRISEYYQHEKAKNWEATYSFRSPTFRSVVDKGEYARLMTEDTSDWYLVEVTIKRIQIKGDWAEIELDVKEYTDNYPDTGQARFLLSRGKSRWQELNGVWYAKEVDSRSRMTYNGWRVLE